MKLEPKNFYNSVNQVRKEIKSKCVLLLGTNGELVTDKMSAIF
jgi:hypothetical protein